MYPSRVSRSARSITCVHACLVAAVLAVIPGCDKAPKPTGRDAMNQHSAALMDELDKYANAPAGADVPGATVETPTPLMPDVPAKPRTHARPAAAAPAHS